jgi:hypothetical protein
VSWKSLLASNDAQTHKTSKQELDNMRALVERDLKDASVAAVSADRRFATAYNAAVQAANMVIACEGYRITAKTGHHKLTLEYAGLTIGKPAAKLVSYFETCRRKRNQIDYTMSHVASETEAKEIVARASEFVELAEKWIAANSTDLAK